MQPDHDVEREDPAVLLGRNLYRARVMRIPRMSIKVLAKNSGVSRNTIAAIEAGRDPSKVRVQPQLDTIAALADALAITVEELFSTRVKRDGKVPYLVGIASRAGPPLPAGTPIQLPTMSGVSSSRDHSSKHRRSDD